MDHIIEGAAISFVHPTLAWNPGALETLASQSRAEVLQPYLTQCLTSAGAVLDVSIISTALVDTTGQMYAIATTERVKLGVSG